MTRFRPLPSLLVLPAVSLAWLAACTGEPITTTPDSSTGNDASTNDSSTPDATVDDAGDQDATIITDGGGDPDPGDGGVIIDAGADSGTCGPPNGNGPTFKSTCSFLFSIFNGGAITAGTYDLVGFTLVGSTTTCNAYVPKDYSGKLVITKTLNGYHFDERVSVGGVIFQLPNRSYDVTASGAQLTVTQTCGQAITAGPWGYATSTTAADAGSKPIITYQHGSGTASVRYRWVKQ